MKQLKKRMLLLSMICVVCFAVSALLHFWYPGRVQEKNELYMLTNYQDYRQVVAAKIEQGEDTITLGNVNGETLIVDREQTIPANQSEISEFFQNVYILTLDGKLQDASGEDGEEYGLDEPSAVVTLADINDGGVSFSIGKISPDSKYYYCSVANSPDVYLMAKETAEIFLQQLDRFYDLSLYPSLQGEEIRKLTGIALETEAGETWRLSQRKASEITNLVYYDMTSPIQIRMDREHLEEVLLTKLQGLRGTELAEEKPEDLAVYGLDEPQKVLELEIDGTAYRVLFGDSTEKGIYAMTEGGALVVLLNASDLDFLDADYLGIFGDSLMDYNIHDLSRIRLDFDGQTKEYQIRTDGNEISVVLAGGTLNSDAFMNLLEKMNSVSIGGACEETAGSRLCEVEVTLAEEEGVQAYEFYEMEDRKCAVAVNGSVRFWCYRSAVEELMQLTEKLEAEQQ